jgi:hypothetical protein
MIDDEVNELSGLLREEDAMATTTARTTLQAASSINPEQAAKVLPYARKTGLPLDTGVRNFGDVMKDLSFAPEKLEKVAEDSPALIQFLSDADHAALAHDDMDFLSAWQKNITDVPKAFTRGANTVTVAKTRYNQMFGQARPEDIARADALEALPVEEYGSGGTVGDVVVTSAEQLPIMGQTILGGLAGGAGGAATGAVTFGVPAAITTLGNPAAVGAAALAGARVGFAPGAKIGAAYQAFQLEGGLAFSEFSKIKDTNGAPMDADTARGAAIVTGGLNAGLELISIEKLVRTVPGGDKVLRYMGRDGIKELAKIPGVKSQLKEIGKRYAAGITTEALTEALQESVTIIAGEAAKALSEGEFESMPLDDALARVGQSAEGGALAATGLGLPGTGFNVVRAIRNNEPDPRAVREYLQKNGTAVKDSKLWQRDPNMFRAQADAATGGQQVFINGVAARALYQELTPDQQRALDEQIDGLKGRVDMAAETGDDVPVKLADYMAFMAPYDTNGTLAANTKFSTDHLTAEEFEQEINRLPDNVATEDDVTFFEEGEAFERKLQTMLQDAAFTPDTARQYSATLRAQYEKLRSRVGDDDAARTIVDEEFMQGLEVLRELPQSLRGVATTDDLFINRAKDYMRQKQANVQRKQAAKNARKAMAPFADMLGGKVAGERKAATPTPITNFVPKVKQGSPLAAELARRDITPQNTPRLFSRDGVGAWDNVPVSEFNAALANRNLAAPSSDGTYVDPDWLFEQLERERTGDYAKSTDEIMAEGETQQFDDLAQLLDMRGIDLATATNEQIKASLARLQETDNASMQGDALYQPDVTLKTDTPEFKAWFGDSKVVDEDGNPLVVYHGSQADIDEFSNQRPAYFTPDKEAAASYGSGNPVAVYLKIENPLELDFEGESDVAQKKGDLDLDTEVAYAFENGYDGVIARNTFDGENTMDQYITFKADQVKSVNNRGTFDANDPRILYQTDFSRVMPRDLFNEAKVLAMHMKFLEDYNAGKMPPGINVVPPKGYNIGLTDSGELYLDGFDVTYNGTPARLEVTYNAGKDNKYPLNITAEELDVWSIPVYNEQGSLDSEFIESFGNDTAQPSEKIAVPKDWVTAKDFMQRLAAVGLWEVDRNLPDDFKFDLKIPSRGFQITDIANKVKSKNLDATLAGKKIDLYLDKTTGELMFFYAGQSGRVSAGPKDMHKDFRELLKTKSTDATFLENIKSNAAYGNTKTLYQADMFPDTLPQPPFYSALVRAVDAVQQAKGDAKQWAGIIKNLPGVKAEELEWSGVNEWLAKQEGQVTKQQLVEYLRANQIDVQEVVKSVDKQGYAVIDSRDDRVVGQFGTRDEAQDYIDEQADNRDLSIDTFAANDDDGDTKFSSYTLPGGKNYRELLLTLPPFTEQELADKAALASKDRDGPLSADDQKKYDAYVARERNRYKSGHYDEKNIVAHIRFNERTDADGGKVLFIEEIQSDWHQAGRKKGYKIEANAPQVIERNKEYFILQGPDGQRIEPNTGDVAWTTREAAERAAAAYATQQGAPGSVPDAPFKTTWPELAFKRALRWAAENGFDKVAWTTGEQQNERYDLSKQISKVEWFADAGVLRAYDKNSTARRPDGRAVIDQKGITKDTLADFIGKDVAERLVAQKPNADGVRELSGLDLKVGGEGMKGFYDKILPAAVNKLTKRWGGKVGDILIGAVSDEQMRISVYGDGSAQVEQGSQTWDFDTEADADAFRKDLLAKQGATKVHSLTITPAMRDAALQGMPLFQEGTGAAARFGPRGQFVRTPNNRSIITLFRSANLSTFLHESAHFYSAVVQRLINEVPADRLPAEFVADWQKVREWVGAQEGQDGLTVDQEEQFARGFELYLYEGNAPSVGLRRTFERFKAWLLRAYKVANSLTLENQRAAMAKALRVELNDDIRSVFDRMLATDQEIEQVKKSKAFAVDMDVLQWLPAEQRRRYLAKNEQVVDAAKAKMLKQALDEAARENSEEWQKERNQLIEEKTLSLNDSPLYKLVNMLSASGDAPKLSRKQVQKEYGKETVNKLPKAIFGDPALPLQAIADLGGYGSQNELVAALMNYVPVDVQARTLADAEMLQRHGDMMVNEASLTRAAVEAFHNNVQREMLAYEYKTAAELAGMKYVNLDDIRARAEDNVGQWPWFTTGARGQKIGNNPKRYYRAEVNAARRYGESIKQRNYAMAAKAKYEQLLNAMQYRAAMEYEAYLERKLRDWRKLYSRSDEKFAKGYDVDYVNAARGLLAKFGLARGKFDVSAWLQDVTRSDPDKARDLIQAMDVAGTADRDWHDLTPNEFKGLADAVDNLLQLGREENKVTLAGKSEEINAVREKLTAALEGMKRIAKANPLASTTLADRARGLLASADAFTARVESLVERLDGGLNGPWHDYVFNPAKQAAYRYRDARRGYESRMLEMLRPHVDQLSGTDKIKAPELGAAVEFENKGQLIGALLHTGNGFDKGSNGYKLLNGYGWSEGGWRAFISRMIAENTLTKADYDLVQQMWDLVGELKPESQEAHKQMYGYRFSEVTAKAFETPFGTYKGGYWPAIADSEKSSDAELRELENTISDTVPYIFPTTGRGFTKKRADTYAAPLQLSIHMMPSHIDKVLRFIHLEPVVKQVARVVRSKDFLASMAQYDPMIVSETIIPWLGRLARQTIEIPAQSAIGRRLAAGMRYIRSSVSLQLIALNMSNALQNVTGVLPAIGKMNAYGKGGARAVARSFALWGKDPQAMYDRVKELSAEVRNRQNLAEQEIRRSMVEAIDGAKTFKRVQDFAEHYGYFAQRATDSMVINILWDASYTRDIQAGLSHDEAVSRAESLIRTTVGSAAPEDISRMEAGTIYVRMVTMLYSYFNAQQNLIRSTTSVIRKTGQNVPLQLGMFYVAAMILPAIFGDIITKALKDDLPGDEDEDGYVLDDWIKFMALSTGRYATAMVPVAGQLIQPLFGSFTTAQYDDRITISPSLSAMERVYRTFTQTVPREIEGTGKTSRTVQDLLFTLGLATKLPLAQFGKPVGYLVDVAEGQAQADNPAQVARGLIGGPAAPPK